MTLLNIIYRETIGRFLSSLLYIGYLVALGTSKKQGFHDMLCDTCVVYKGVVAKPTAPRLPYVELQPQQQVTDTEAEK